MNGNEVARAIAEGIAEALLPVHSNPGIESPEQLVEIYRRWRERGYSPTLIEKALSMAEHWMSAFYGLVVGPSPAPEAVREVVGARR